MVPPVRHWTRHHCPQFAFALVAHNFGHPRKDRHKQLLAAVFGRLATVRCEVREPARRASPATVTRRWRLFRDMWITEADRKAQGTGSARHHRRPHESIRVVNLHTVGIFSREVGGGPPSRQWVPVGALHRLRTSSSPEIGAGRRARAISWAKAFIADLWNA
jgi:hypothetical protein